MPVDNQKFLKDLERYVKQQEQTIKGVVSKTIVNTVKTLVERSPVGQPELWNPISLQYREAEGYQPGKFKGSWNVTFGSPASPGFNAEADPTGSSSLYNATAAMTGYDLDADSIFIVNTATNETNSEYYPAILETQGTTKIPGFKPTLNSKLPLLTYFYQEAQQDGVLGSFSTEGSKEFKYILENAVKTVK